MAEGQTLYLHMMLTKVNIMKVIVHGITLIHSTTNTTINKTLATTLRDQQTVNSLTPTLPAKALFPANSLEMKLKELLLSFYKWQRLVEVAFIKLEASFAFKDTKVTPPAQLTLFLRDNQEIFEELKDEHQHLFIEHLVRMWTTRK
jgi:hypothetical protein